MYLCDLVDLFRLWWWWHLCNATENASYFTLDITEISFHSEPQQIYLFIFSHTLLLSITVQPNNWRCEMLMGQFFSAPKTEMMFCAKCSFIWWLFYFGCRYRTNDSHEKWMMWWGLIRFLITPNDWDGVDCRRIIFDVSNILQWNNMRDLLGSSKRLFIVRGSFLTYVNHCLIFHFYLAWHWLFSMRPNKM